MSGEFKDKFIAFVDLLGFKELVRAAEAGTGRTNAEIDEILHELEGPFRKERFTKHGPATCPNSPYVQRDLDFEVTQISDCVIVSAEVSPAGIINLVNHAWGAAIMLLTKGLMVRGYITRGNIYHQGTRFRGTGYQAAYEKEQGVSAFKHEADEKGTPFIEVDSEVCSYVDAQTDWCVREMFDRLVKRDGESAAIFPFQSLSHSFAIGRDFDPRREKAANHNVRKLIQRMKAGVLEHVDTDNERAMRKARHYLKALDEQLAVCDQTDDAIERLK